MYMCTTADRCKTNDPIYSVHKQQFNYLDQPRNLLYHQKPWRRNLNQQSQSSPSPACLKPPAPAPALLPLQPPTTKSASCTRASTSKPPSASLRLSKTTTWSCTLSKRATARKPARTTNGNCTSTSWSALPMRTV